MDGPNRKRKNRGKDQLQSGASNQKRDSDAAHERLEEEIAEEKDEIAEESRAAATATQRRRAQPVSTTGGNQMTPQVQIIFEDIKERGDTDSFVRTVNGNFGISTGVGGETGGIYPSQTGAATTGEPTLLPNEIEASVVLGILERDGNTEPTVGQNFNNAFALARAEYEGNPDLYKRVFAVLVGLAGEDPDPNYVNFRRVRANEWATVAQALAQQGVKADDIHMVQLVEAALAGTIGASDGRAPSSLTIVIPDIENLVSTEIIKNNLEATKGIYFFAMLDELKFVGVIEKLVELWQVGQLPIGKCTASDNLYKYWRQSATRMTEIERRNLYARTFGLPGGDASMGQPNREFNDLWLRFVSAVSQYARQFQVDQMFASRGVPVPINQEQLKKAAADLAGNLSLHGYGMAFNAAIELGSVLNEGLAILNDNDIKGAFGAKDPWQVIDQVATTELGGARNSVKYRTMATSGAAVIAWLGTKADQLSRTGTKDIINLGRDGDPKDNELVDACDQWLAVTGTSDSSVEQYAQPSDVVQQPTRPIQIPSVARDLLASVGVKANGAFK